MNLAGNAIKFTERGGVGITVKGLSSPGDVCFSVCDTGPGVPEDRRESIFEEFEQADGSYSRRHEGTGLGLAISKSLVALMGGELRLERSGPDGSVFSFSIKLSRDGASFEAPTPNGGLGGKSALIVASSPFGGPFLGERLAELGANVARVEGEAAALAILRKSAPDLVIIDCALGEPATHRLALAAREKGAARNLVLFSPFERRAFGEALIVNFDGWLVKPIRLQSLYSRLDTNDRCPDDLGAAPAASEFGTPLKGRKILLAEDNDVNALLVERHLSRLGAEVVRARDGAAAVALACGNVEKFDTVLMDVRMPGVDGLAAARQIRAAEQKAGVGRVRIVALTANASDQDRAAALQAGMDSFVAKPFDLMEMVRAVAPKSELVLAEKTL
jgi:CheY-like chemotaxis protein